jgi:lysophospholipase L1-like esterase
VFIGNSITQGAQLKDPVQEAPPVQTVQWLQKQEGIDRVNMSNQGVSGLTTVDFLPASQTFFPKVKMAMEALQAEHPDATLLFSMMLGTNDSANSGPNG